MNTQDQLLKEFVAAIYEYNKSKQSNDLVRQVAAFVQYYTLMHELIKTI